MQILSPPPVTTMFLLSPAPSFSFFGGEPRRRPLIITASARFSEPMLAKIRRDVRSLCVLPRSGLPSIELSKHGTSSFSLNDPVSFLLDGAISLLLVFRFLPSDFFDRWQHLVDIPEKEAEAWLAGLPSHLIQAVTASEDHRFFSHNGIDLHGLARAVVNYPNGGGGSTITQQIVKRAFLTSERKLSRKFIEGILSLKVEKRMSKWKILYSYLKKMYWGNGIYGIELASQFYFGKGPSYLSVGESAMLAGILPGPEILNPLKYPKRSKSSQIKVLRRMVSAGYLDMEKALQIAGEPFYLRSENKNRGVSTENDLASFQRKNTVLAAVSTQFSRTAGSQTGGLSFSVSVLEPHGAPPCSQTKPYSSQSLPVLGNSAF